MTDPLVVEPSASHDASIIWMHGLGASAYDFVDMPRLIARPGTRWVFPNAPVRPVTLNNGWKMPSWFDIRYLAGQSEGERECPIEAQESSDIIAEIIESEHKKGYSVRSDCLGGIQSRWCDVALHRLSIPPSNCRHGLSFGLLAIPRTAHSIVFRCQSRDANFAVSWHSR